MGFRFRRSVRLAPGIRWNVGLKSSSISVGGRGATLNFGKRGARATVGLPGTGISFSHALGPGRRRGTNSMLRSPNAPSGGQARPTAMPLFPKVNPDEYGVSRVPWKLIGIGVALATLLFSTGWGMLTLVVVGLGVPSRQALGRRELRRRVAQFEHSAKRAGGPPRDVREIDRVLNLPVQLSIPDVFVKPILEELHACRELALFDQSQTMPPLVAPAAGGDPCYFSTSVTVHKRGPSEQGTLFLGPRRLLFVGPTRIEVPWEKVASSRREGAVLTVQRTDRVTPYRVVFDSSVPAVRAEWILMKFARSSSARP